MIGGGLSVGAYGGRADIMAQIAPAGPVYQAGTLSGNPLAVSAGLAMLRHLKAHPEIYRQLEERAASLVAGVPAGHYGQPRRIDVHALLRRRASDGL